RQRDVVLGEVEHVDLQVLPLPGVPGEPVRDLGAEPAVAHARGDHGETERGVGHYGTCLSMAEAMGAGVESAEVMSTDGRAARRTGRPKRPASRPSRPTEVIRATAHRAPPEASSAATRAGTSTAPACTPVW